MTLRRWGAIAFAAVGLLALVAGLVWRGQADGAGSARARLDGATLLAVALPDPAGKEQSFNQWKGKVLVVNFWATWCDPCREEMPRFIQMQDQFANKGVQFVGIAIDQADRAAQFASEIHVNYPTLMGGYGSIELSKSLGNSVGALPFTVVVDRAGAIVFTQLGPIKDSQLRSIIGQLV
jgi:thiol-disulfide isomerase/thioredoxin